MGRVVAADILVLATGGFAPARPSVLGSAPLPRGAYAGDPWAEAALSDLSPFSPVLLLGSGLTMVDVALSLDAQGHQGRIHVLSRRGLLPRRHEGPPSAAATPWDATPAGLSARVASVRRRASEIGWRPAMDELRPISQALWINASAPERRRFLRHLRPWWDVHRHRMAPAVADWVETQLKHGRMTVAAGRVERVEADPATVRVSLRRRGRRETETIDVARIINCTGAGGEVEGAADPLWRSLLSAGLVRTDALGLGLDVRPDGQVVNAKGASQPRLYAVGPLTRAALWEIVAVPDIRNQVAAVADRLARSLARVA